MPVNLSRIESGIYLSAWVGRLTAEEFNDVGPLRGLVEEHGDAQIVIVVDTSQCKQYPLSIETLKQANANMYQFKTAGYVFITAPSTIKALASALMRTMGIQFAFCGSYDEAVATARTILEKARTNP